jgi:hypothetical protein
MYLQSNDEIDRGSAPVPWCQTLLDARVPLAQNSRVLGSLQKP